MYPLLASMRQNGNPHYRIHFSLGLCFKKLQVSLSWRVRTFSSSPTTADFLCHDWPLLSLPLWVQRVEGHCPSSGILKLHWVFHQILLHRVLTASWIEYFQVQRESYLKPCIKSQNRVKQKQKTRFNLFQHCSQKRAKRWKSIYLFETPREGLPSGQSS